MKRVLLIKADRLVDGKHVYITCSQWCAFFKPKEKESVGCILGLAKKHYHPGTKCPVYLGGEKKMTATLCEVVH
jgi:hypothetical protein